VCHGVLPIPHQFGKIPGDSRAFASRLPGCGQRLENRLGCGVGW